MKLSTILVATDFSDLSKRAVSAAVELAKMAKGKILLLHVVENTWYPGTFGLGPLPMPDFEAGLRDAAQAQLAKLAKEMVPATVQHQTLLREGTPWVDIVEAARDKQADMIVLATHGRTGIKHAILGSHAERVVRTAHCPVLTIPPPRE